MTRRVSHEDLDALLVLYSAPPAHKRAHGIYAGDLVEDLRDTHARIAELEAELAEARKDGERLSWMIDVSNSGMGWIEDAVWDSAPDIEGCHDVQVLIRAAIDAARGKTEVI